MPHMHHSAFESFSVSAALILLALVYVRGWVQVRRRNLEAIDGWRGGSFLLGVFSIWLAMASPVTGLDHELLTVHMVQHLLLMTFAPPLIWLAVPMKPLLHGLPPRFGQVLSNLFGSAPVRRLGKNLARPRVCWLAAAGTLVGWHVPALFMLGFGSQVWHTIEQASFLTTGLLFWWPVIKPWPADSSRSEWSILLYLFLATFPCDILSAFLVFCDRAVYPIYFSMPHPLGLSALQDQENAGALMWTCVTVVYLIAGTIFAARLLSPERSHRYGVVKSDSPLHTSPQAAQQSMEVI